MRTARIPVAWKDSFLQASKDLILGNHVAKDAGETARISGSTSPQDSMDGAGDHSKDLRAMQPALILEKIMNQHLTRRNIMVGAAAVTTVAPVISQTPAAASESSTLAKLIEDHRWRRVEFDTAVERLEDERVSVKPAEVEIRPGRRIPCNYSAIEKEIEDHLETLRSHMVDFPRTILPASGVDLAPAVAIIDAEERRLYAALDEARGCHRAAKEASSFDAAETAYDIANDAEAEALDALLSAPCETLDDVRLKAAYLNEATWLDESEFYGDRFSMFLGSLIGGKA